MRIVNTRIQNLRVVGQSSAVTDSYFNLVSLLLPGNGTNGAQNNTFLDSSTNNFSITRNANTTQGTFSPFSQTGWSNYFDGSGDYLSVPYNTAFSFGTGDFTVECWANISSVQYTAIISSTSTSISTAMWLLGFSNTTNEMTFGIDSGGSAICGADYTNYLNKWTHIAASRSGSTLKLFFNGVQVASVTNSTNFTGDSGNALVIGRRYTNSDQYHINGYISNLRVVKGTALYTAAFTPPTAPLTAISGTSLLTCQSNRFIDNSSNAFAITVSGNTSVQAFSPFNPTSAYSAATIGGSGYFDGTGDYLSATYSTSAFDWWTTDYTIEAWVYPTTLTGWGYTESSFTQSTMIGNAAAGSATNYWSFGPYTDGTVKFKYYNGTSVTVTSTATITAGQWSHIAMVKDSSGITLYVNGVKQTTTAISGTPQSSTGTTLTIGQISNTSVNGYISNLRIVKGTAVYTNTFTPPTAPLTAITNTSLLLSYTNGGITDAAAKNVMETAGNVQESTAQSKFGGSSIAFDGSGDYLQIPASQNFVFGSGNFTVEFWLRLNSNNVRQMIAYYGNAAGTNVPFLIELNSSFKLRFLIQTSGGQIYVDSSATPSSNTWIHVAGVRNGSSAYLFVDGVSQGTITPSTNALVTETNPLLLGMFWGGSWPLNGYINDFRITKGYARYTSNFTPPATAFPVQ